MKIQILIIGFILLYISAFSQTKIDRYVVINIPGTVKKMEIKTAGVSVSSFYSYSKAESYFVMRMAGMSNGSGMNGLPEDFSELENIYDQLISDQIKSMGNKGFLLLDTKEVRIKNYLAYKIIYRTSDSKKEIGETLLLCLDGVFYVFTYSRVGDYSVQHKEQFQRSLKINSLARQVADESTRSESIFSIFLHFVFLGIIILILTVFFFKMNRDKLGFGINLSRVYCPDCQTKQPFVRMPANQRQALFGGHTCRKCNTEMDKYGVAITSENSQDK